jgi:hypothetical protein
VPEEDHQDGENQRVAGVEVHRSTGSRWNGEQPGL